MGEQESTFDGNAADNENANSSASAAGTTDDANGGAGNGGQGHDDKDHGFADHPAWQRREQEWNDRFAEQEERHKREMDERFAQFKEELGAGAANKNVAPTKAPSWFGGTQEQWDEFTAYQTQQLTEAEKRAEENAYKRIHGETAAEQKAIEEATSFLNAEVAAIERDKELNPTGQKLSEQEKQELLEYVLKHDLVDSRQRWNYRAGRKLMLAEKARNDASAQAQQAGQRFDRKRAAAAVGADRRSETKQENVASEDSFKGKDRPW